MKKRLLLFALSATLICSPAISIAAESIGQVGKIFSNNLSLVVRKQFGPDKPMKRHNHSGAQIVLTVVTGKATFTLNDAEKHELKSGDVLIFDDDNFISGEFSEETLIVVTLIEKEPKK